MQLKQHLLATFCAAVAALSARAADWYVDAVNGNNSNNGSSSATAWRTISYALSHTPTTGVQSIHIAAGLYDDALGETFPLDLHDSQQLIGAGPSATQVNSTAAQSIALKIQHFPGLPYSAISNLTQVSSMSISAMSIPIVIYSRLGACKPELRDIEATGGSQVGILVNGDATIAPPPSPLLERVKCSGNGTGLLIDYGVVSANDCTFKSNSYAGVDVDAYNYQASGVFRRCRIERNYTGVSAHASANPQGGSTATYSLQFFESSISGNSRYGVWANLDYNWLNGSITLQACTIANNYDTGVATYSWAPYLTMRDSILFGNFDDLLFSGPLTVTNCDIGDGDFAGTNGNFAADPLFVNAAGSDWRLRWNSPCIDVASLPATTADIDLAGNPRVTDGNLDTLEVRDLGAFEFAPLYRLGSGAIGTQLALECWGQLGATSTVYFSRLPLAITPMNTASGQFDLDPAHFGFFKSSAVGQSSPVLVTRQIPNALALVGQTFSFQALTISSSAPSGFAYTNPVQFTITP